MERGRKWGNPRRISRAKGYMRHTSTEKNNWMSNFLSLFPGPKISNCKFDREHSPLNLAGNVFVIGLTAVINEVLDLTAAQSLEFILQPCIKDDLSPQTQSLMQNIAVDEAIEDLEI